jgi:hypothetical protein
MGSPRSAHHSIWPAHHRQVAPPMGSFRITTDSDAAGPGGPGTRSARLEVITDRVHSGHDSVPVRAVSACPTSAEQRAQPLSR